MKRTMLQTLIALAMVTTAQAHVFNPPEPPEIPGWPPYGQNIDRTGPDATFESRQRRKLLRHLFPGATNYPRDFCHFTLYSTPEKPNPPYRARNLQLNCKNPETEQWIFLRWGDR